MLYFFDKKFFILLCISITFVIGGCCGNKNDYTSKRMTEDEKKEQDALAAKHVYTVSATSSEDLTALNNAANAASKFCIARDKQLKIIDYQAKYFGLNEKQKNLVEKANEEFGEHSITTSNRDYKATVKFRCVPKDYYNSIFLTPRQLLELAKREAKS